MKELLLKFLILKYFYNIACKLTSTVLLITLIESGMICKELIESFGIRMFFFVFIQRMHFSYLIITFDQKKFVQSFLELFKL